MFIGMVDSLGAENMRAGLIASVYGHSGRHLRFVTIVTTLVIVNLWLWARLALDLTSASPGVTAETVVAELAATVSLFAIIALWRDPLGSSSAAMATPSLRHSLATHHAGHIVAMHIQDPTRVTGTSLRDRCVLAPATVPPSTETSLRIELTTAFAGLCAEEVFAGESGSHSADDLARATVIGADMVGRFGMTGSMVSLATTRRRRAKFIDRVLDDARTRKELEALLRDSKRDSVRIMLENRHLIIALRDALMRNDSLSSSEIRRILNETEERRHSDDEVLVDLRSATDRTRPLASASEL